MTIQASWITTMNPGMVISVSVVMCICISVCFVLSIQSNLGILCSDEGDCEIVSPNTLYTGCLPDDVSALTFVFFDSNSHVVLSCTTVEVVYIQFRELTCNSISSLFTTSIPVWFRLATLHAWVLTIREFNGIRGGPTPFLFVINIFCCKHVKLIVSLILFCL